MIYRQIYGGVSSVLNILAECNICNAIYEIRHNLSVVNFDYRLKKGDHQSDLVPSLSKFNFILKNLISIS